MAERARFLLTFDFELGWGAIESGRWRAREAAGVYRRLRQRLPELLALLDELDVPATWATVGGMLVPRGQHDLDYLPPALADLTRAALREGEATSFDGRDLFERVVTSRARHQIASHTYAHPRFTRDDVDAAAVRADLRRFRAALPAAHAATDRLVFPQNAERYHDVLAGEGVRVVRGADKAPRGLRGRVRENLQPPLAVPDAAPTGGVDRLVGSVFFHPGRRRARLPLVLLQAQRGLARAVATGGTLHVWLHPFNLAEIPGLAWCLGQHLRSVARARDAGKLAAEVW
jgi:hypothetical protein